MRLSGLDIALALRQMTARDLTRKIGGNETEISKIRNGTRAATARERAAIAKAVALPEEILDLDSDGVALLLEKLTDSLRLELASRMLETHRAELATPLRR
jgi:hypothetical protein